MLTGRRITLALVAIAIGALTIASAFGAMRSKRLSPKLCVTKGGGRFVDIPKFPGEKVDRRLLRDVRYLRKRYKIFITDGYSTSSVHSINGEHPIGLALDIVPDKSRGGSWKRISRLAKWAEPSQNQPRRPFRWVGYNGDAGHGRGHHLHLSWAHSDTKPFKPARRVYSLRCPGGKKKSKGGNGGGKNGGGGGGGTDGGGKNGPKNGGGKNGGGGGGVGVGKATKKKGSGGVGPRRRSRRAPSGGISADRRALRQSLRAPVAESGGVGIAG